VNDPERAIELARLGVDVLITDHPAHPARSTFQVCPKT